MERGKKTQLLCRRARFEGRTFRVCLNARTLAETQGAEKQWRPGGHAGDQDFAELVALGAASAEALLAKIHGRAIDFAKCHYLFETAPQELPDGTHSRVGFLWQWEEKPTDENPQPTEEYHISIVNMHHLLHHNRMVPLPPSFAAAHLEQQLEEAALADKSQEDIRKPSCGCTYLGACKTNTGRPWAAPVSDFQKDPAKFPTHAIAENGRLSQASVW